MHSAFIFEIGIGISLPESRSKLALRPYTRSVGMRCGGERGNQRYDSRQQMPRDRE